MAADFEQRVETLLVDDPFPHRTRRIVASQVRFCLSCGRWRIFFEVRDKMITISEIKSAAEPGLEGREGEVHHLFQAEWPEEV